MEIGGVGKNLTAMSKVVKEDDEIKVEAGQKSAVNVSAIRRGKQREPTAPAFFGAKFSAGDCGGTEWDSF